MLQNFYTVLTFPYLFFMLKVTRIKLHNTLALPALLYGSQNRTIKSIDARRITAAEMKCMRKQRATLRQIIKDTQRRHNN
jgi:hypothetical protein